MVDASNWKKKSAAERYNRLCEEGLCVICGKNRAIKGLVWRETCKEHNRQARSKIRKARIAGGMCVVCGKRPAAEGVLFCQECSAHHSEYFKKRRAWARENGMCVMCFREDAIPGRTLCPKCRDMIARNKKAYLERKKGKG